MKKIILLLSLLATSQGLASNFLSYHQEAEVLEELYNVCGDTWCEGDFNFSFYELKCDSESKTCNLSFEYINEVYNWDTDELVKEERVEASCTISDVEGFDDIIDSSRNRYSLVKKFYFSVGDCIDNNIHLAYDTFDMD